MPTVFQPLFGSTERHYPSSYYIEIDEAKVLLDCGCFEHGERDIALDKVEADYIDTLTQYVCPMRYW